MIHMSTNRPLTPPGKEDCASQTGLELIIDKARKLGFSKIEINKLRAVYSPRKIKLYDPLKMIGKSG